MDWDTHDSSTIQSRKQFRIKKNRTQSISVNFDKRSLEQAREGSNDAYVYFARIRILMSYLFHFAWTCFTLGLAHSFETSFPFNFGVFMSYIYICSFFFHFNFISVWILPSYKNKCLSLFGVHSHIALCFLFPTDPLITYAFYITLIQ